MDMAHANKHIRSYDPAYYNEMEICLLNKTKCVSTLN